MNLTSEMIQQQVKKALEDLHQVAHFSSKKLLVIGTSTSEVRGSHIGTDGTKDVAAAIYQAVKEIQRQTGVKAAFQSCEHLNRALVIEENTAKERGYDIVSAVPIRKAGGAMATYAFRQMESPVLVEEIEADAGIDIGDTFIGMHLKKVAVPVRSEVKSIGDAHLTMATTRPKLIGGIRAVYDLIGDE